MQTKFNLYQVQFRASDQDLYTKICFNGFNGDVLKASRLTHLAIKAELVQHVSVIEAANLEHAFGIANLGPEESIESFPEVGMRSMSIGDIIEDPEQNNAWICDSNGFTSISSNIQKRLVALRIV